MKIFREMLFLEGYSNRPQDLVDARDCDQETDQRRKPRSSLRTLWLLGGRPMHAGHNFDQEEPLEGYAVRSRPDHSACCS